MFITNSFSLNMVSAFPADIHANPLTLDEAKNIVSQGIESAVGHEDTAAVFSSQLGFEVKPNRITISLKKRDRILVGQYKGPRLPEGTKTLPEGATIEWLLVELK